MEYYTGAITLVVILIIIAGLSVAIGQIKPLRKAVIRWIDR